MPSSAAIALDAVTDGGNNGGTTNSLSWSHTATGSNLLLVVCLLGGSISSGFDDITSFTSGGTNMTQVVKYTGANSFNNGYSYIYILPNAPTGAHTISITTTHNHFLLAVSATYTGTSSTQPDNFAVFPASGASPFTTSMNTFRDQAKVLTCEGANTAGPAATCTQQIKGAAFNEPVLYDNPNTSPPASVSCGTRSNLVTNNDVHSMMSIIPFGALLSIHHKVSGN